MRGDYSNSFPSCFLFSGRMPSDEQIKTGVRAKLDEVKSLIGIREPLKLKLDKPKNVGSDGPFNTEPRIRAISSTAGRSWRVAAPGCSPKKLLHLRGSRQTKRPGET